MLWWSSGGERISKLAVLIQCRGSWETDRRTQYRVAIQCLSKLAPIV